MWFDEYQWESNYPDILREARDTWDVNAGQESILEGPWYDAADSYCSDGEAWTYDGFISHMESELSDGGKYEAVSKITEQAAWDLEKLWNFAAKGEGGRAVGRLLARGILPSIGANFSPPSAGSYQISKGKLFRFGYSRSGKLIGYRVR